MTTTFHRSAALLVGAVLVSSAGSSAEAGTKSQDRNGLSAPIARGVLADNGRALQGADVVAIAWPNQRVLGAIATGDEVPTYVIGRTKTDATGGFAIDVAAETIPAMFRGEGSQVDVELVFGDTAREGHWHYTVVPDGTRRDRWASRGRGQGPVFRADLATATGYDVGDDPALAQGSDGKPQGVAGRTRSRITIAAASPAFDPLRRAPIDQVRTARARAHGRAARSSVVEAPSEVCQAYAGTMHYGLSEYFMQAYAWSGAMATVAQKYGNDHTLGIGYSATGSSSGFRASGTQSTNMAASATRGGIADAYVYNKVNYRDYGDSCSAAVTRRPHSVNALLTNFTYTPHVTYSSCTTYTGGTYTKYQGTNVTYGAGMDIGPINVSAQSGWNTNTEISWTVTKRSKICGSTAEGWARAPKASASAG